MLPYKKKPLAFLISSLALALAPVVYGQVDTETDESEKKSSKGSAIEQVVVTASKRESAASDLPMNITAISGEALREQNITDVKRLIQDSVELSAPDSGARFSDSVTVRGLNVSPVSANNLEQFVKTTLAYYIDDTPLPKLGFRIKDIQRVEKLLGPQGTLYGSGSLGGTIRYITNEPNLEESQFSLNTSAYQVNGGGVSSDTDFVINLPLSDTFAVRASGAYLDEAGYIDRAANAPWRTGGDAYIPDPNPNQVIYKDDNWQEATTAKISALWAPADAVEIKLTHMQQDQLAHGTRGANLLPLGEADEKYADIQFGDYKTPYAINAHTIISPHEEYADKEFSLDVLDIEVDLGFATLTSSTSKFEDTSVGEADYTSQGYAYYGWAGFGAADTNITAYMTFDNAYEGFSHETRLVSTANDSYEWILGFYTTEQESSIAFREIIPTIDQELSWKRVASVADVGYEEDYRGIYSEDALFGEFSYNVTDKLTMTAGARIFNYEDKRHTILLDHTFALPDQDLKTKGGENGKSFFKLNASYDLNSDVLAYATFSQGFRRGGRNTFRDYNGYEVAEDSKSFEPDSIDNFELGVKGYFFDQQLYVQSNVYQMNWSDPQTYRSQAVEYGFPINGTENGPDAETRGWEFSSRYRLNDNWSLTYSTATTEGRFTDTLTHCMYKNTGGDSGDDYACATWVKGDLLGGSPKWKHNLGVSYSGELAGLPVWASVRGRYVGKTNTDREDTVIVVDQDTDDVTMETWKPWVRPSYTLFHASAGMRFDKAVAGLWVNNLLNDDPIVSSQSGGVLGRRIFNATPRTIGLNVSYDF
ncbi:hypothetical protein Maes01_00980 [Microbulbifer aestuariivivens]|uniref:TonB-dependent receptor n=1 Tax=Microbulbifer aestuariivivens TaxID=1908308 RepID=A0ABP9WQ56_9GAMM